MGGKFAWVKPEVYPLIAAMGIALGLSAYSMARNLYTNPDVHLTKTHRAEGIPEATGTTADRAQGYRKFILRKLQEGKENSRIFN